MYSSATRPSSSSAAAAAKPTLDRRRSSVLYIDVLPGVPESAAVARIDRRIEDALHDTSDEEYADYYLHGGEEEYEEVGEDRDDGIIRVRDILELPARYWALVGVMLCYYASTIPFVNVSSDFARGRWGVAAGDVRVAGIVVAVPDAVSTVLVP
ncbi:hypothetical protein HK104_004865, partial [Borealophlyctis nickersoniae]